jgi:hypothetical protein
VGRKEFNCRYRYYGVLQNKLFTLAFVQLIQIKAVSITEVLPEDKIQTLTSFSKVTKESLNALMEKKIVINSLERSPMYKQP